MSRISHSFDHARMAELHASLTDRGEQAREVILDLRPYLIEDDNEGIRAIGAVLEDEIRDLQALGWRVVTNYVDTDIYDTIVIRQRDEANKRSEYADMHLYFDREARRLCICLVLNRASDSDLIEKINESISETKIPEGYELNPVHIKWREVPSIHLLIDRDGNKTLAHRISRMDHVGHRVEFVDAVFDEELLEMTLERIEQVVGNGRRIRNQSILPGIGMQGN